jgi:hypothetical protein
MGGHSIIASGGSPEAALRAESAVGSVSLDAEFKRAVAKTDFWMTNVVL